MYIDGFASKPRNSLFSETDFIKHIKIRRIIHPFFVSLEHQQNRVTRSSFTYFLIGTIVGLEKSHKGKIEIPNLSDENDAEDIDVS